MTVFSRRLIGEALVEDGLISSEDLKSIMSDEQTACKDIGKMLIEKGMISEEKYLSVLERKLHLPRVNLFNLRIDPEVIKLVPVEMARRHRAIPLKKDNNRLFLALVDPLNLDGIDTVAIATGLEVQAVLACESSIERAIDHYYNTPEINSELINLDQSDRNSGPHTAENTDHMELTPIIKAVNAYIYMAIEAEASDIHFEPSQEGLRVRMRLDGVLKDLNIPIRFKQEQIISRIKIMANLDIAEKRLPQDGNIQMQKGSRDINLRVSTMPTIYGEKIVIRLLEKERIVLPLAKLGFADNYYRSFKQLLLNQSGMILVTGPTGCGKTTTLYSALNYLNRPGDNIITVEDPVECRISGINQIQINRRINRTFANTLRSILRQDPDIIMIGEIRDLETAKIATQAALTGHLVLSTLHTNNAAGAVTRLIDMGLEAYLVTASVVGVIAQRLIRAICPQCKEAYKLTEEEKHFFKKYFKRNPPEILLRGAKCSYCNQTGYRGRTSIQELLLLTQEIQALILAGATAIKLQQKAAEQGMQPLVIDGLRCMEKGITTMSEVVRTTFSSIFDNDASGYAGNSTFIAQLQKYRD